MTIQQFGAIIINNQLDGRWRQMCYVLPLSHRMIIVIIGKHFTEIHECQCLAGTSRKVSGSPKSLGFTVLAPFM